MAVVVNTNIQSIKVQNCLNRATDSMNTAMERMSTGLKINSARDDAANSVISTKMGVQVSGTEVAQNNVQAGSAMLNTMEGNIDVVIENVQRIRDLALQAKNQVYSSDEMAAMQEEVDQRIAEINRISVSARYSEISLFNDTATTGKQNVDTRLQVGANAGTDNTISIKKELFASVNLTSVTSAASGAFTLSSDEAHMNTMITELDEAITNYTNRNSLIGAIENRLESAASTLESQYQNLSSAKSVLTDADMAEEASNYTQQNILQQISTSLLAQANQAPAIATSLI